MTTLQTQSKPLQVCVCVCVFIGAALCGCVVGGVDGSACLEHRSRRRVREEEPADIRRQADDATAVHLQLQQTALNQEMSANVWGAYSVTLKVT
jgi:hypothetical protein